MFADHRTENAGTGTKKPCSISLSILLREKIGDCLKRFKEGIYDEEARLPPRGLGQHRLIPTWANLDISSLRPIATLSSFSPDRPSLTPVRTIGNP